MESVFINSVLPFIPITSLFLLLHCRWLKPINPFLDYVICKPICPNQVFSSYPLEFCGILLMFIWFCIFGCGLSSVLHIGMVFDDYDWYLVVKCWEGYEMFFNFNPLFVPNAVLLSDYGFTSMGILCVWFCGILCLASW